MEKPTVDARLLRRRGWRGYGFGDSRGREAVTADPVSNCRCPRTRSSQRWHHAVSEVICEGLRRICATPYARDGRSGHEASTMAAVACARARNRPKVYRPRQPNAMDGRRRVSDSHFRFPPSSMQTICINQRHTNRPIWPTAQCAERSGA